MCIDSPGTSIHKGDEQCWSSKVEKFRESKYDHKMIALEVSLYPLWSFQVENPDQGDCATPLGGSCQVEGSRQISPVTAFIADNAAQRKWQNNCDCIEHNVQSQKSSVQLIEPDEVIDRVLFAFNSQKILDNFSSNEQAET